MMNLFAFVTAYPEELKKCDDPLGDNDDWLYKIATKCDKIIFAWGSFKEATERANDVINNFEDQGKAIVFLSQCISPITTLEELVPELKGKKKFNYLLPDRNIRPKHQLQSSMDKYIEEE